MTHKPQQSRPYPASIGPRAEQSGGDALQQPKRLGSHGSVDHQRRGDVQHTAKQAAPENGQQSIRVRRRQCSGRRVHEFYTEEFTKEFRVDKKRFWPIAAQFAAGETRWRVNMLTHRSEKTLRSPEDLSQRAALC